MLDCQRKKTGKWCSGTSMLRRDDSIGAKVRCPDCRRMWTFVRDGKSGRWAEVTPHA